MIKMKLSRRALEMMDEMSGGETRGKHGPPDEDGLMEVEVDRDRLNWAEGLRLAGETLSDAVERSIASVRGENRNN